MSLQKKLNAAAVAAATEAVQVERGRCLWILDCMMKAVEGAVKDKIMTEAMQHAATVKVSLAKGIVAEVRRGIISGLRPPTPFSQLRQPNDYAPTFCYGNAVLFCRVTSKIDGKTAIIIWFGRNIIVGVNSQIILL